MTHLENERIWQRAVLEKLEAIRKAVAPACDVEPKPRNAISLVLAAARIENFSCCMKIWDAINEACAGDIGLRERAVTALSAALPEPYTNGPLSFFEDAPLDDVFNAFYSAIGAQ